MWRATKTNLYGSLLGDWASFVTSRQHGHHVSIDPCLCYAVQTYLGPNPICFIEVPFHLVTLGEFIFIFQIVNISIFKHKSLPKKLPVTQFTH